MIPEFPHFKKIELTDKKDVEKFTSKFPPYSDFNFVSMWSWDIKNEMRISVLHGNLVVKFTDYLTGEPFYSFLGNHKANETVGELIELSHKEGVSQKLQLVPEESVTKIDPEKFYVLENRNHFDYVYHISDLYKSNGKKYETHRNLLNRFSARHHNSDVEIKSLSLSDAKKDILILNEKWKIHKKGRINEIELKSESRAVERIFSLDDERLLAICIFHKGDLVAYSINELLRDDHALCHFAKANVEFAGIYSFLMKKTCEIMLSHGKHFLNYEQDLGFPHLRYSKTAFQPHIFLKKFSVIKS